MANASVGTTVITEVRLNMSGEEAVAVLDVLRRVSGIEAQTRRKHTEAVANALIDAGVVSTRAEFDRAPRDIDGSLMFVGSDR